MTASTEPVLRCTVSSLCLPFCSQRTKVPPTRAYKSRCLIRCRYPPLPVAGLCVLPPNCVPSCLTLLAHCPIPDRSILSLALEMGRSHPDPPLSRSCPAQLFLIRPHSYSLIQSTSLSPSLSLSLSSPLSSLRHPILSFLPPPNEAEFENNICSPVSPSDSSFSRLF